MARSPTKAPSEWQGRPIISPDDSKDLDTDAALHEFDEKMPRDQAEEKAHHGYRRHRQLAAATWHLQGMKSAGANSEEAKKHGALYSMHLKALGLDPNAEPPAELRQRLEDPEGSHPYKFKPHKGDLFVLAKCEPLSKGWPKDDAENTDNAQAHAVLNDAYQGGAPGAKGALSNAPGAGGKAAGIQKLKKPPAPIDPKHAATITADKKVAAKGVKPGSSCKACGRATRALSTGKVGCSYCGWPHSTESALQAGAERQAENRTADAEIHNRHEAIATKQGLLGPPEGWPTLDQMREDGHSEWDLQPSPEPRMDTPKPTAEPEDQLDPYWSTTDRAAQEAAAEPQGDPNVKTWQKLLAEKAWRRSPANPEASNPRPWNRVGEGPVGGRTRKTESPGMQALRKAIKPSDLANQDPGGAVARDHLTSQGAKIVEVGTKTGGAKPIPGQHGEMENYVGVVGPHRKDNLGLSGLVAGTRASMANDFAPVQGRVNAFDPKAARPVHAPQTVESGGQLYHTTGLREADDVSDSAHRANYQMSLATEQGNTSAEPARANTDRFNPTSAKDKTFDRNWWTQLSHAVGLAARVQPIKKSERPWLTTLAKMAGKLIPFPQPKLSVPKSWDAAAQETAAAGPQLADPNVVSIHPKQHAAKEAAKTRVQGVFDTALDAMGEDPGFKQLARQRETERKEAKLKAGGANFTVGQKVHHVDQQAVPWQGTVASHSYRDDDIDGPGHYYEVKWWDPKLNQHHEDYLHQDNLVHPTAKSEGSPGMQALMKALPRTPEENRHGYNDVLRPTPDTAVYRDAVEAGGALPPGVTVHGPGNQAAQMSTEAFSSRRPTEAAEGAARSANYLEQLRNVLSPQTPPGQYQYPRGRGNSPHHARVGASGQEPNFDIGTPPSSQFTHNVATVDDQFSGEPHPKTGQREQTAGAFGPADRSNDKEFWTQTDAESRGITHGQMKQIQTRQLAAHNAKKDKLPTQKAETNPIVPSPHPGGNQGTKQRPAGEEQRPFNPGLPGQHPGMPAPKPAVNNPIPNTEGINKWLDNERAPVPLANPIPGGVGMDQWIHGERAPLPVTNPIPGGPDPWDRRGAPLPNPIPVGLDPGDPRGPVLKHPLDKSQSSPSGAHMADEMTPLQKYEKQEADREAAKTAALKKHERLHTLYKAVVTAVKLQKEEAPMNEAATSSGVMGKDEIPSANPANEQDMSGKPMVKSLMCKACGVKHKDGEHRKSEEYLTNLAKTEAAAEANLANPGFSYEKMEKAYVSPHTLFGSTPPVKKPPEGSSSVSASVSASPPPVKKDEMSASASPEGHKPWEKSASDMSKMEMCKSCGKKHMPGKHIKKSEPSLTGKFAKYEREDIEKLREKAKEQMARGAMRTYKYEE